MTASVPFEIRPLRDIPTADAKLLGHDKIISNLKSFLESDHMITPLSIAIHGEWGSGKTSIMKTLENNLDSRKFETLFFEAWKYEYSNPSLGLITEIAEKFAAGSITQDIIRAGAYILSKKYLGATPDEIMKNIRASKAHADGLSTKLKNIVQQKIGDKKLIIIIDDLDRCDVENSLQLIALMKLFLDLENCICVAAVDFKRLKQAWRKKYLIDQNSQEDGSEYLDKIFQVQIGIPKPPPEQIEKYVMTLIKNLPDLIAKLFSKTLPTNPRTIKRILNLISYRIHLLDSPFKEFSSIYWTLLEEIITNKNIIYTHDRLISQGRTLGDVILTYDGWKKLKSLFEQHVRNDIIINYSTKLHPFFEYSNALARNNSIPQDVLDTDFQKLYNATNDALK